MQKTKGVFSTFTRQLYIWEPPPAPRFSLAALAGEDVTCSGLSAANRPGEISALGWNTNQPEAIGWDTGFLRALAGPLPLCLLPSRELRGGEGECAKSSAARPAEDTFAGKETFSTEFVLGSGLAHSGDKRKIVSVALEKKTESKTNQGGFCARLTGCPLSQWGGWACLKPGLMPSLLLLNH